MIKPAIEGGPKVRERFIVFGEPDVRDEDIKSSADTMSTCWLGTGSVTEKFENEFASYKKVNNALGVNSCTAALHLALMTLNLKPGDEVITTDYTFTATVSSILHANLTPVLVDCQSKTQNIEWSKVEEKITPRTKVIIVVHFAGLPCQMNHIVDICKRYSLYLIEDAAHCIEGEFNGRHCGTFGDFGCFSFYSTKNITTATGEGGMLISDNDDLIREARTLSLHGMSKDAHSRFSKDGFKHYQVLDAGFKYNLTDTQSAFAISQLKRIDNSWLRRHEIWNKYKRELIGLPIYLPPDAPTNIKHAYHLFTIQLKLEQLKVNRDYVLDALREEGIGTGVHYQAIHTHPFYINRFGWTAEDFPVAQWLSDRTISLPISAKLSDGDIDDVIAAVRKILLYYKKI